MAGPQLLLDRYRVLNEIGAGGFGTVEHAYDTRLRRDVAIKAIPLSEADQAKAHLAALENELAPSTAAIEAAPMAVDLPGLDEARAAAQLSDPSIVTVYDFEIHDGIAYIIMEYIEGVTLTELLEAQGDDITLDEIAAVFDAVATALTKAHQAGVLHLDVKPDNVLIDANGAVKVTDFGLATLVDASGTGTTGGGTIGYMPLEQMRREPLDGRTDEWALAAMTYTMLTGSNPYEVKGELPAAEAAIESVRLDPPSRYWEPLGPDFDAVIDRALAPNIDDRHPTVKAFAKNLRGFLGSPREGKAQLSAFMNDEAIDHGPIAEAAEPPTPLVDRIGEAGATLILRGLAVLGVVVIVATALVNVSSETIGTVAGLFGAVTEGGYASMGVAGAAPWLFWVLVAVCGVLAAVRPEAGAGVAWVVFALVWIVSGQWLFGLILLGATALWWWLAGRHGPSEAVVGVLEPLAGSIGFGALAPIVAGTILRTPRALVSVLWSIAVALAFAGLGSTELMGWNVFLNITAVPRPVIDGAIACASRPETWCVGLSWFLATILYSLLADRGGHRLAIVGAFIAAALLIAGVCTGAWFASYGLSALPSVFSFIGALIPGVLGIIFAILGVPEKSREPQTL